MEQRQPGTKASRETVDDGTHEEQPPQAYWKENTPSSSSDGLGLDDASGGTDSNSKPGGSACPSTEDYSCSTDDGGEPNGAAAGVEEPKRPAPDADPNASTMSVVGASNLQTPLAEVSRALELTLAADSGAPASNGSASARSRANDEDLVRRRPARAPYHHMMPSFCDDHQDRDPSQSR